MALTEWDRQIAELKRKEEARREAKLNPNKKVYGRCKCGSGKFSLKMNKGIMIRTCHVCNHKKEV